LTRLGREEAARVLGPKISYAPPEPLSKRYRSSAYQ